MAADARVHPVAEAFRSVAELYERARPGYPEEALAFLGSRLALREGRVVADVGAGTGKLTRGLVETGARVIAVEPLAEMREQLARTVPRAESLAGTAEELPLADASVDAVTVGQAFHWFDHARAVPELARVLREGGALALLWNVRDLDDPLQARLNDLMRPYRGDAPSEHEQPWRPALEGSPWFGPLELRAFEWHQPHTPDELADRVGSVSFVAGLPEEVRAELLERVRALARELGGTFSFRYRTDVWVFPRTRDQVASGGG